MEMRVVLELLAPGMEHRQAPQVRAEMLGVAGDIQEGLGDGAKEQRIEHAGILEDQGTQLLGQGKDCVDIGRVEDVLLLLGEPGSLGGPMALGTMPVATRVIAALLVVAVITAGGVPAEGGGAAQQNSAEGAVLCPAQGGAIAFKKGGTVLAYHVSDFECRAAHGSWSRFAGNARASRGLAVACTAVAATWR